MKPPDKEPTRDELVAMEWLKDDLRLTMEFAPPRTPAPPGVPADRPILRVLRLEAIEPEAEDAVD